MCVRVNNFAGDNKFSNPFVESRNVAFLNADSAGRVTDYFFFFKRSGAPRDLHSSPPRRSSDLEDQRDDAPVDEVGMVDAGEGLPQHRPPPQVHRREGGMLARSPLPVVVPADDESAAPGFGPQIGRAHV